MGLDKNTAEADGCACSADARLGAAGPPTPGQGRAALKPSAVPRLRISCNFHSKAVMLARTRHSSPCPRAPCSSRLCPPQPCPGLWGRRRCSRCPKYKALVTGPGVSASKPRCAPGGAALVLTAGFGEGENPKKGDETRTRRRAALGLWKFGGGGGLCQQLHCPKGIYSSVR